MRGGLWIGFGQGGISYLKRRPGRASYGSAEGLGKGRISRLQLDQDGTLWAATRAGLAIERWSHRHAHQQERPAVRHTPLDDGRQLPLVWLNMPCGLVRIARSELDAWSADPKQIVHSTIFDSSTE